jgi:hypothetical protein
MAIGVLFELQGATREQYDHISRGLTNGGELNSPGDWPVEGLLAHVAGPTENGWRVVDVWESEEAFQRFGEQLAPQLQEAGVSGQPEIFQVHNFVR